jgi:uncharacterized protein
MGRPVHFEISAEDPERAAAFYEQALGWSARRWDGSADSAEYWLLSTGDGLGIDGGMTRRGKSSFAGTTLTIDVEDLNATLTAVERAGGTVLMPAIVLPGIGHLAYCSDPEGNAFSLMRALERP